MANLLRNTKSTFNSVTSKAPLPGLRNRASKVVCIGRNYADHISELKNVQPKRPFFFLKPTTSIIEPPESKHVFRPKGIDLHYEVELALIIGNLPVRDLKEDDIAGAMNAIQGYVTAIDLTARNLQNDAKSAGMPWTIAKGFDTFLPLSRQIPKTLIPDPHDVQLYLNVNGKERQNDSTNLMLFRIPKILSEISGVMTLEPHDIVLTGTPKGVGSVQPGDMITAGVQVEGTRELEAGRIEVEVKEREGGYVYKAE